MTDLSLEIKQLIVDALGLEDITPADIGTEQALFGSGLGLDSIDALELGVAIKKKYNISIDSNDKSVHQYFESVKSLVKFVEENRNKK